MAEDSSRDRRDDRRGGPRKSFGAGGARSGPHRDKSRRDRSRGDGDPRGSRGGQGELRRRDRTDEGADSGARGPREGTRQGRSAGREGAAGGRGRDGDSGGPRHGDRATQRARPDSAPRGPRSGASERERPAHNPADLRAANRADQERSPDIDADVTGKELDRGTLKEIGGLDERPGTWVAKHLVMAGRYLDEDPALAFQHALAASRKGGRLARVREAVALTAYAAGEYQDALREFRTYRRMTGDDTHIAAQVDCERALGRLEKALLLADEVDQERLDRAARVELAMVISGVREDLGDLAGAHHALQIPELDRRRGYPFSPRLFQRQADVLAALGRDDEAAQWRRSVRVAERALGIGGFAEPEIVDVDVEPEEEAPGPRGARDRGAAPRHDHRAPDAEPAPEARTPESSDATDAPDAADALGDDTLALAEDDAAAEAAPDASPEEGAAAEADPQVDPNQMSLFDGMADADVADAERRREEP